VLRGGSWNNNQDNARSANRNRNNPNNRNGSVGLWSWKAAVIERLAGSRLVIHASRAQVLPVDDGIPWLGFVVYPTHRLVKARKARSAHRRLRGSRPIMWAKSASPSWMPASRAGSPMSVTPTAGGCAAMSSTVSSSALARIGARSRRGRRGMAKKIKSGAGAPLVSGQRSEMGDTHHPKSDAAVPAARVDPEAEG
jgi:hypothetical protein